MKKGILVVSFGTTHPDTRKLTIEAIERHIGETFGGEWETGSFWKTEIKINSLLKII